ncbi:MAG: LamG-like jellyroll fold domain-containing protein, partial [Bacteroidota bacterium]
MPQQQSSPLINKNTTKQETHDYVYTTMVSHRGNPVSFAMRNDDGGIFYSVLNLSNTSQGSENDKLNWSKVSFNGQGASRVPFPAEIAQVGYGVVPNFQVAKYNSQNEPIIHGVDLNGNPIGKEGEILTPQAIRNQTDLFYSSTARLGAKAPFQALSDGKYIYLFRQSIPGDHPHNQLAENGDAEVGGEPVVNNTLLVDRFILSGSVLKLSREIRFQRSRHKTEPESRKDTLAAADMEGNPFFEPTKELAFANGLSNGNFSVLLIPGADPEQKRWQIFTGNTDSKRINSFNIRFDASLVFDTSDSEEFVDSFKQKFELNGRFIPDIQSGIRKGKNDLEIAQELLSLGVYREKGMNEDSLAEVTYTIRTGVAKDDFTLESTSEWPLIEYKADENIEEAYLENGLLKEEYAFLHGGDQDSLAPVSSPYIPKNGLTACYYHQQEIKPDGKPMKTKAAVMLAIGLEDKQGNAYIGILNFAVAANGRLSRITTDAVNMPDINVQALDENPYSNLEEIPTNDGNQVAWQQPQKMRLLNIDQHGLGTSGGVLKFAYTSASIGISQGYSDAVLAKEPYLFDDSLGRVNLYFKGRQDNFFVLYFNPNGSQSNTITDRNGQAVYPSLVLTPRIDRDLNLQVTATVSAPDNTASIHIRSADKLGEVVEAWNHLPKRFTQIAPILNGDNKLPLGTLAPLGGTVNSRIAYLKSTAGQGKVNLRTTVSNNLVFQEVHAFADHIGGGDSHSVPLTELSTFLSHNSAIQVANKSFTLLGDATITADLLYKSYLVGLVNDVADSDKLWAYLQSQGLVTTAPGKQDQGHLTPTALKGNAPSLSQTIVNEELANLNLQLLQVGNAGDKNARLARLKQALIELILDVAKVRFVTFQVQDANAQLVDNLEAGLEVQVYYNYQDHFRCFPENLGGASAWKWEQHRSYLFSATTNFNEGEDPQAEITAAFDYDYTVRKSVGQWEDWEASLALQLTPASNTDGAALYTTETSRLDALEPTEKGLSVEAWVKPDKHLTHSGMVMCYQHEGEHYSLGIERDGTDTFRYVAMLGNKLYLTQKTFSLENEQWRHLAFTHKKYWGYQLDSNEHINCGNDSSLQLPGEFALEVLVQVDKAGVLLEKPGEYRFAVDNNRQVSFHWAGKNYLEDSKGKSVPEQLEAFGQFYKITLIRSRNKPQNTGPSSLEYPITGGDGEGGEGQTKWYEGKSTDELIKGMAEKQDQMDEQMGFAQTSMLGGSPSSSDDPDPRYYHTLVVTQEDGSCQEWTSNAPRKASVVEAFQDLVMGGKGFVGTFASVRMWNRVLTLEEAKNLSLSENTGGLLSHWRMAEGDGTYLYDEVRENHGVAQGGTWTNSPQSNQVGQFQFYVDGTPELHETPVSSVHPSVEQFTVGGILTNTEPNQPAFSHQFQGTLEEIRIWDRPRSHSPFNRPKALSVICSWVR